MMRAQSHFKCGGLEIGRETFNETTLIQYDYKNTLKSKNIFKYFLEILMLITKSHRINECSEWLVEDVVKGMYLSSQIHPKEINWYSQGKVL